MSILRLKIFLFIFFFSHGETFTSRHFIKRLRHIDYEQLAYP